MVVLLTERLAVVVEIGPTTERLLAVLAYKAVGVPGRAQRIDAVALDCLIARGTALGKHRVEVLLTVRPTVPLEELTAGERLEALSADEVVNVPLLSNCCNRAVEDREVAMGALCLVLLRETTLTVSTSISFPKTTRAERSAATGANKACGVEGVATRSDHLSDDGLTTTETKSSGRWIIGIQIIHFVGKVR